MLMAGAVSFFTVGRGFTFFPKELFKQPQYGYQHDGVYCNVLKIPHFSFSITRLF